MIRHPQRGARGECHQIADLQAPACPVDPHQAGHLQASDRPHQLLPGASKAVLQRQQYQRATSRGQCRQDRRLPLACRPSRSCCRNPASRCHAAATSAEGMHIGP